MKFPRINKSYFIPSKDILYTFVFNLLLLVVTLLIGYYYIPAVLQRNDNERIKEQNYLEKKNEFLKDFTELGQSRIYLAERYFKNVKATETPEIIKKSWDDYMTAVIAWNKKNLLNPIFLSYYFNNEAKDEYYNNLIKNFVTLHEALLELRDGKSVDDIKGEELIEAAKNELFSFSEKLFFGNNK